MKFSSTKLQGVFLITLVPREDERGHLVRTWDQKDFANHGINHDIVEGYTSYSVKSGTMRGLHYRVEPFADSQLVRCISGSIFEVVIDLRPDSSTYQQWVGFTQRAADFTALFVPPSIPHGFLTLEDNTEVLNLYSKPYNPQNERGVRYNDPAFGVQWPIEISSISPKDLAWPDWKEAR